VLPTDPIIDTDAMTAGYEAPVNDKTYLGEIYSPLSVSAARAAVSVSAVQRLAHRL